MKAVIFVSAVVVLSTPAIYPSTPENHFYEKASLSKLSCEWRGEEDCYLDFVESMAPVLLVRSHQKASSDKASEKKINYIKKISTLPPWYSWVIVFLLSTVTYLLCLRFAKDNLKP